ncbi:DMT family transporter [Neptuniibacter halophilus]|uniref:DMT family transporter n=1 Tax=Neptuniibacter halophilus TaxID=651666 RepID=UPI002573BE18|nr:DMT family transporter [Neptuniibacter halophilus]
MATQVIPPREKLTGFLFVLCSAVGYGLQPFFTQVAYADQADPIGLLFLRFTIASALMLGWISLRRLPMPPLKHCLQYLLVGLGYSGAAMGYYNASYSTSFSLAVILMFSFPAFVVLFSVVVLKEPLTRSNILCIALALSGVAVTAGMDLQGDMKGILWALFAAFSYGSAIIYGSHKAGPGYPLQSACLVLLGCMLTFAVASTLQEVSWPATQVGWNAIIGLALFGTILPIATFIVGSPKTGAANASIISTLEPVVAIIIAVTLIGEPLSNNVLFGGCLVVMATLILLRSQTKARN